MPVPLPPHREALSAACATPHLHRHDRLIVPVEPPGCGPLLMRTQRRAQGWNGRRDGTGTTQRLASRKETDEPGIEMAVTLAPGNAVLRDWQTPGRGRCVGEPARGLSRDRHTGGGETRFALRIAHHYLPPVPPVVSWWCPTNHLRTQGLRRRTGRHSTDPALSNDQALEARDHHGAVVTYQQVCLAPEVFRRACRSRKTLVILDELHHAGDGKDWGKAPAGIIPRRPSSPRLVRHALSVR